jgi:hypothetical protein
MSWHQPGAHGPYSTGGFKGKGPKGNRLPKQRPSQQNKGCAVIALALFGGIVALTGAAGKAVWEIGQSLF